MCIRDSFVCIRKFKETLQIPVLCLRNPLVRTFFATNHLQVTHILCSATHILAQSTKLSNAQIPTFINEKQTCFVNRYKRLKISRLYKGVLKQRSYTLLIRVVVSILVSTKYNTVACLLYTSRCV